MRRAACGRCGGFSLVELALTLAIVGALGLLLWQLAPRLKSLPAIARLTAPTLVNAEDSLNGFILANSRLPCPDTTPAGGGPEDCSAGATVGWLPVRTLGLSLSERVRYGVYRAPSLDADLAALPNRHQPLLPAPLNAAEPVYLNGLDFCVGLRNLTGTAGGTVLTAGLQQVPIAYGLAVAGAGDADNVTDAGGNRSPFDGLNTQAGRFALAGTAHGASYDDDTRAVGGAELFTRLGCATRLASANAAARAAYAAYDLDQVAAMYASFRVFQVTVSDLNKSMADTGVVFATADLAIAIAGMSNVVALLGQPGSAIPAAAAAILSAAAIGLAIYSLTEAINGVQPAIDDLATANSQNTAAQNFNGKTLSDLGDAAARVGALDAKGLLP